MRSRWVVAVGLSVAASAAPARAQSAYVSVSLAGDVVRFTHSEAEGVPSLLGGGEATGFALRVGTPLGSRWGVEAEFARPSTIENEGGGPDVVPLVYRGLPYEVVGGQLDPRIYPIISYRVRTSQRNTTFSTAVWARQDLSPRFALVYLGGVGFHRMERDIEYTYGPGPRLLAIPIIVPPRSRTDTVTYTARPLVGIEARIGMTDHLELVPGVRLHGLESGVLVRPSVGLGWTF